MKISPPALDKEISVQDHSHKLLFMAATGAMCAIVVFGSQAATSLLFPGSELGTAEIFSPAVYVGLPADEAIRSEKGRSSSNKAGASVLPNSASCPAADALVAPPAVNDRIGREPDGVAPSTPAQAHTNAILGTGSACPPLRADAAKPRTAPLPGLAPGPLQQAPDKTASSHP